ncbi:MAG: hypothetical protein L3K26_05110 [Candidatus Hydrogenedentes bacterium]|nr:hypothetical protein [Candidatus Hydrogenedentota bacterium]
MNARHQVGLIFCLTFIYALLRYVILHDVAWSNVPLYVLNKSISWSGVVLFGMSLLAGEKDLRRYYGTLAFAAIVGHLFLSLMVLNPHYFAKFYGAEGRMNGVGETSMLAGVLGILFLGGLFFINLKGRSEDGASLRAGWGRMVLWCAAVHVAIMGYASWMAPGTWQGYLPPITLLSFMTALYFLYARNRRT